MWTDEHKLAIQALMEGDEQTACRLWQKCIRLAEESNVPASVELGEAYHYCGKILMDLKRDAEAVPYLEKGYAMLNAAMPEDQATKLARQHLSYALRNSEQFDKADALHDEYVKAERLKRRMQHNGPPMKKAIKVLQKNGIALELDDDTLAKYCAQLGLDVNGDNYFIDKVMLEYYRSGPVERAEREKCFVSHYTEYDIDDCVKRLAALVSRMGKLQLEKSEKANDWTFDVFLTFKKEGYWGQVTSCDGLTSLVNDILQQNNAPERFWHMAPTDDKCEWYVYFLLRDSQFDKLQDKYIIELWD